MGSNTGKNHGRQIGEIVRSALSSGDLSRLKDLGPAVEEAVRDIPGVLQGGAPARDGVPYVQEDAPKEKQSKTMYSTPRQPQRPAWQGSAAPAKAGAGIPKGVVRVVFGVMGAVVFGLGALTAAALALLMPSLSGLFALAIGCGALCVPSALLCASGLGRNKLARRVAEYEALFARKKVYSFNELAAATGRVPKAIKKDIRAAKKRGFLADVRTDADETLLMKGEDTYTQYLETEKRKLEKEREEEERLRRMEDPETASLERFRSEGVETIRKIRNANEAIPGEEISEKLSRLEAVCARIFTYVEEHPDKLPDTRKFMNYYLPTTLKLVEKYREYEELQVQPTNVRQAKREIEDALDNIATAFGNLLESLYAHDTLDVSTDTQVLQKMLEQEGLTGRQFEIGEKDKPGA